MCGHGDGNGLARREFLKLAARGAGGMALVMFGGGLSLVSANAVSPTGPDRLGPPGYDPTKHRFLYLVDIDKCIGCGSCVRACERENQVPRHFFRTWIERYQVSSTGEVFVDSPNGGHDSFPPGETGAEITKAFFVPKICNHCTATPCVQLCPVGASYRTPDGLILVDEQRCIGCGYCVQACPYGSRFIHPEKHVASKCTFCYHRVTRGLKPACVGACPVGARKFGDVKDPNDEVAQIIATQAVRVLKPDLLTEPNCYYLGLGMEVH